MNIVEYLDNTDYMVVFSNEADKALVKEHIGACIVIELHLDKMPTSKKVLKELQLEIDEYMPKRILTVGTIASKLLLGNRFSKLDKAHGGLYMLDTGVIVVPTFDSTDNPMTTNFQRRDIERFKKLAYTLPEYIEETEVPKLIGDVYLDIETTGLAFDSEITSIQLADDTNVYYKDIPSKEWLIELYYHLMHKGLASDKLIGHNIISFDLSVLSVNTGLDWFDTKCFEIYDTMVLAHNRGLSPINLKHLTSMYTDVNNPEAYQQETHSFDKVYAVADVVATRELYKVLTRKGLRAIDHLTCNTAVVFAKAHMAGIAVDKDVLHQERERLAEEIDTLYTILYDYADINWNAPKDVSEVLISQSVPLSSKTATGQYSVASDVLEPLREKWFIVDALLKYREYTKLLSTFYDKYTAELKGGYTIHPLMLITGTDTGRSSCKNPNLQQVPSAVKKVFISRYEGGGIAQFDLAQSELRCAVFVSGDKEMANALSGVDYHTYVASQAFQVPENEVTKDQRKIAKQISFGLLLFGGSAKGLAARTGADETILQSAVDNVKATFKALANWQAKKINTALDCLKVLIEPYGYIRDVTMVKHYGYGTGKYKGVGNVKRAAMNSPIQGVSAFICYELCRYIDERLEGYNSLFICQIHDSVFIDVYPGEEDYVKQICIDAFSNLNYTRLAKLPGWRLIPAEGELTFNRSMYEESEEVTKLSS